MTTVYIDFSSRHRGASRKIGSTWINCAAASSPILSSEVSAEKVSLVDTANESSGVSLVIREIRSRLVEAYRGRVVPSQDNIFSDEHVSTNGAVLHENGNPKLAIGARKFEKLNLTFHAASNLNQTTANTNIYTYKGVSVQHNTRADPYSPHTLSVACDENGHTEVGLSQTGADFHLIPVLKIEKVFYAELNSHELTSNTVQSVKLERGTAPYTVTLAGNQIGVSQITSDMLSFQVPDLRSLPDDLQFDTDLILQIKDANNNTIDHVVKIKEPPATNLVHINSQYNQADSDIAHGTQNVLPGELIAYKSQTAEGYPVYINGYGHVSVIAPESVATVNVEWWKAIGDVSPQTHQWSRKGFSQFVISFDDLASRRAAVSKENIERSGQILKNEDIKFSILVNPFSDLAKVAKVSSVTTDEHGNLVNLVFWTNLINSTQDVLVKMSNGNDHATFTKKAVKQ